MKPQSPNPLPIKKRIRPKADKSANRLSWILTILASAGFVIALLSLPAIPELISEEEYQAKNKIFTFDEAKGIKPDTQLKSEEGQMGKRDSRLMKDRESNVNYGIKGPASAPSQNRANSPYGSGKLGISGTGRGGGGTGEGTIGFGALSSIGHGGGGGSGSGYSRGAGGLGGRGKAHRGRSSIQSYPSFNTENYQHIQENTFMEVSGSPVSTFSIDVDTASYANMRRFLTQGTLPPKDAVRIEELVNYFTYAYATPDDDAPFSTTVETTRCPWNKKHFLSRIGLRAKKINPTQRPVANLVFLIDVSGSMRSQNKLLLLKQSMKMLVNQLQPTDRVAIVVYAGASGMVLESTPVGKKMRILDAIHRLEAGGGTNGGAGIHLAYQMAQKHYIKNGINRIILATDGDFNVGTTSHGELTRLIEAKRETGVYLSVLGFGMGNYKDSTLEQLADKGNGNYAYIDSKKEAQKVLVEQAGQTLITVAKDVKIQVEFNPRLVSSYRLIGYENRKLQARDFNDDQKDAGEIGAGHTVTAMYELIPKNIQHETSKIDSLRYQSDRDTTDMANTEELYTLKLRYKKPNETKSLLQVFRIPNDIREVNDASVDFKFAASVAGFGMLLRDSKWVQNTTFGEMRRLAKSGLGKDASGYRSEFINLIHAAQKLTH